MISIRGAATVEEDNSQEVLMVTRNLLGSIMARNNLMVDDIISIVFTCTQDIKSVYPAAAAREMGIVEAGLICVNEMNVTGSLAKCIRVLILANVNKPQKEAKHVYMGGARILRPDLSYND